MYKNLTVLTYIVLRTTIMTPVKPQILNRHSMESFKLSTTIFDWHAIIDCAAMRLWHRNWRHYWIQRPLLLISVQCVSASSWSGREVVEASCLRILTETRIGRCSASLTGNDVINRLNDNDFVIVVNWHFSHIVNHLEVDVIIQCKHNDELVV